MMKEKAEEMRQYLLALQEDPELFRLMQIARTATPEQIKIAVDLLNDRKKKKLLQNADADANIEADFVLLVHGNSMTGARIHDNDLVFIKQQSELENGDIAAVVIGDDEEVHLTRFYRYGDIVVLHPENPMYRDTVYTGTDANTVRILGKAVAFQSELSRR